MTTMPIQVIHVASGDLWAGAEVQLYHLAQALHARDDVQIQVMLLNQGMLEERLREAGIPVEVFSEQNLGFFGILRAMRARLKRLRPHLVHSHRYKENLLTTLAAFGLGSVAVRTIHSATQTPQTTRGRLARIADTLSARLQEAAVCVSPELARGVRKRYPDLLLEVIENGIDITELQAVTRRDVDESLLGTGLRVGFVGRLVEIKRPDLFVTMAHLLERESPGRYSFHLFGDGPKRRECQDFVMRHNLSATIRFMGFQADLPAWLRHLDALIICSDHEGLPMVLLEAMTLGIPVIAHAVGGIPHVLGGGTFGLLVHNHSMLGYADALRALVSNPDETAARVHLAREHVRNRYDVSFSAGRLVTLYRALLSTPATRTTTAFD